MEFRLNRIDTDLRQRINDAVKEGKVHSYKNISIYKDKKEKRQFDEKYKLEKAKNKKLIVTATKAEELEVEAYKEEMNETKDKKGFFLDEKI